MKIQVILYNFNNYNRIMPSHKMLAFESCNSYITKLLRHVIQRHWPITTDEKIGYYEHDEMKYLI